MDAGVHDTFYNLTADAIVLSGGGYLTVSKSLSWGIYSEEDAFCLKTLVVCTFW